MSQVLDVAYQALAPEAARPSKRIRTSTAKRLSIATAQPTIAADITSAPSLDGTFPIPSPRLRRASLPPQPRPGRKKKQPVSDPWIQEAFTFPSEQTWLKIKSKQKRSAVLTDTPATSTVEDGEELSLDRHADRIAALIAQKRRDNDATAFRERIALRRGDDGPELLKRKMHDQTPGYQSSAPSPHLQPMHAPSPVLHHTIDAEDLTQEIPAATQFDLPYPYTHDYSFQSWLQNAAWTSQMCDALPTAMTGTGYHAPPNAYAPAVPPAPAVDSLKVLPRPNINMFTRQTRETMIGGNNLHETEEPRRNMFANK